MKIMIIILQLLSCPMSLDIILHCGSGLKKYKFALNAFNALIDTVIDSIICLTEKPISKKHIE